MASGPQRIIMGIDPGTNILGFGVILIDRRKVHLVDLGVLDLRKCGDHFSKLKVIFEEVGKLIEKYTPDDLAIEAPFYGKNVQVMLKLGRAQGAAVSAALSRGIPVFEYAPRKAKIAVTGEGAASKEQVAMMLQKTLGVEIKSRYLDATDALAIAMCHFYQLTNPLLSTSASTDWKSFIEANPERVK